MRTRSPKRAGMSADAGRRVGRGLPAHVGFVAVAAATSLALAVLSLTAPAVAQAPSAAAAPHQAAPRPNAPQPDATEPGTTAPGTTAPGASGTDTARTVVDPAAAAAAAADQQRATDIAALKRPFELPPWYIILGGVVVLCLGIASGWRLGRHHHR